MIYQLNLKKYSHFSPLNINLKTIYCSLWRVSSSKVSHLHRHLVVWLFLSFSPSVSTYIRLKAMFRAASFDGQFALLIARHLYFLFFVIIVLLHLANKICSFLLWTPFLGPFRVWHFLLYVRRLLSPVVDHGSN